MSETTGKELRPLYPDESLLSLNGQLKKRWLVLGAVAAVLLGVFVWSLVIRYDYDDRLQWISIAAVVLLGFFTIFWVDVICGPLFRYRSMIRTALTGRQHTKTMPFVRAEEDISVVDGVPFRGLIFLGDPDKHGTRDQLLYWDREIPMPAFTPGNDYTVRYSGRVIVEIENGI